MGVSNKVKARVYRMRKLFLAAFLFCASFASAQNYNMNVGGLQYTSGPSVPVSCSREGSWFFKNTTTTGWYQCVGGVYIAVPTDSTGSVPFSGVTPGTNTGALKIGTGGSLASTGTGSIAGNLNIFGTSPAFAPSPLATTACPSGQGIIGYGLKADSNYQDISSWDNTTTGTGGTTANEGAVVHCWKQYYNNTGAANTQMKNRFLGIQFSPGLGGAIDSATQQGSAIGVGWYNDAPGSSQAYQQENTIYGEFVIGGTPTFAGVSGAEVDWGGTRMTISDHRTGGTQTSKMYAFSALADRSTTADMFASGGTLGGYRAYLTNSSTGALAGNGNFVGFQAEGQSIAACSGSGCKYSGFRALAPVTRWASGNVGFRAEDMGTNALDNNFQSIGANASSTPSGFNQFYGPVTTGNGGTHPPATVQLQIVGGVTEHASFTFATLPASPNGSECYCSDCNATCTAGGGTGRMCFRENGAWTH